MLDVVPVAPMGVQKVRLHHKPGRSKLMTQDSNGEALGWRGLGCCVAHPADTEQINVNGATEESAKHAALAKMLLCNVSPFFVGTLGGGAG